MQTHQQRNEAFLAFLEGLNPAQRQAVDQIEGPVLVIAGPGAGKTQVLAARIGNILLQTDARPQNILCLTFTDAGVESMRRRLLELIGTDAHRVPIMTFHAFCNRVIQENLEYFGKAGMEPLSELERAEIIRDLLKKLPTDHPLKSGYKSAFAFEKQIGSLFASMKSEGWTPGAVIRSADQYVAQLPENEDFIYKRNTKEHQKGELKVGLIADQSARMDRLKSAADLFPKYTRALEESGRYEYDDMILWVLKAFEKHPELLRVYQERYLYFLIDEYQDTNGAQNGLLQKLIDYWETPNVFIVGDDDQSIFEFQGARLQNLLDFYQKHRSEALLVALTDNYRSSQNILDAASRLIENNELRVVNQGELGLEKRLRARSARENLLPEIWELEDKLAEETVIAADIERHIGAGASSDSIAVIFAKHRQGERLMQLLTRRGVAVQTKRPVNALQTPLVQHIIDWLHFVEDELNAPFSGEWRLFRLLHAPHFGLKPLQLARLALQIRQNPALVWREAAGHLHPAPKIEDWIAAAASNPPAALIDYFTLRTGLTQWILDHPDRVWLLQILHSFFEFIRKEAARTPDFRLAQLLALFDTMQENRITIPVVQQARSNDGKGVQLLTAHSAKGLEFDRVYLLDCTRDGWEPGLREVGGQFSLPPTLTRSGEEDGMEARRRLFYVAMTRAKSRLVMSYARHDDAQKPLSRSRFIDETGLPVTAVQAPTDKVLAAQAILSTATETPRITLPESALLDELLKNWVLTITHLNRYLRCPLAFYYEDLLKVPLAESEASLFGQSMHASLQHYFLRMKAHKQKEWPSAAFLTRYFQQEMQKRQGRMSHIAFEQRTALGKSILLRYHAEEMPYWRKNAMVEQRFDRVNIDGTPITGVVDKLERLEAGWRVIDYKTGAPKSAKLSRPTEDQPFGGEYWRQLIFYKLLVDESHFLGDQAHKGAIAWLEPDKKGRFLTHEIDLTSADAVRMREIIASVWEKIQTKQFNVGCGASECPWCKMHADRQLIEIPGSAEEELDDFL